MPRVSDSTRTPDGRTVGPGRAKESYDFPVGFLWGAATSSHQVEGGNRSNDWWAAEQAGLLPHASGDACLHYELYERDFDLARAGGHNAHRFSVEWSRIEPEPRRWDEDALEHYRARVVELQRRAIEPIVTLHHFTNPRWFAERGGWLRGDAPELFGRYVEKVAGRLSTHVRYWLTINEPTVYVKRGFVTGDWPPGRRRAWLAGARTLRNLCRAHRVAYPLLHRHRPDAMVGLAHSALLVEPCRPERRGDRLAARLRDEVWNGLVLRLVGARPRPGRPRALDFLGINYYTRSVVHGAGRSPLGWLGAECAEHRERGPRSDLGWEVYPEGLVAVLERFSSLGLPLMITENGVATRDEALRSAYLVEHLRSLGIAVERGLDVIGYLHWSLIDNFEWSHGRAPRFGLVGVDYETQARRPKPAFALFESVCRGNRLDLARLADGTAGR